jgi:tetratricopeptide (TPR) repeat protein
MAGKEQMLMDKYEDALSSFQHCVNIKADDAESYSAIGNIYLRDAQEAYAQFNLPLSDPAYEEGKENIQKLYQKACDAFEQARKYDESKHDLWLPGLRETYFKLNKGKALKALERYK